MATDGTQFLIDMAAKLTGGDASVATLGELGDRMLKAGATAVDFERTIKATSVALEESTAAITATGDAVAAGETKYKQAEIAADRAAKAVERLNASGKSGDAFGRKLLEAGTKAEAAAAALRVEAVALDALKVKAGAAAVQHDALSKGLKNVKGAAEQAAKAEAAAAGSGKVNEIAEGLGKLGGPAGVAGQRLFGVATGFKKLSASIGAAGPYVAMAVAIVAIATAALFATVAIGKWAVGMADAGRTQSLLAAGVARSVEGGRELDATIRELGDVVPQTRDELLSMASDLAKTGLRGKDLTSALEEAAVKAATLKFGPDFGKQMLSLDVQSRKLGTNLADTFGGLKIDSLLEGFQTLVGLFNAGTESGKALKFLFEALFQPVIDGAAGAIPKVERLFLQAEILALKAYIALKPYREEIAAVGKALLIGAAVIVGVVVVAFALLAATIVSAVFWIGAIVYAFAQIPALLKFVGEAIGDFAFGAVTFLADLGANMIQGLVNGITGGATAVVNAMTGVVGSAIDAAKHALGIASESKVLHGIGGYTAEGFASGVEGGTSDAQGALESLVAPPSAKGGGGGGGSSLGGVTIQITVDGRGESDDSLAKKIADAVRDIFESDALSLGGGEAVT